MNRSFYRHRGHLSRENCHREICILLTPITSAYKHVSIPAPFNAGTTVDDKFHRTVVFSESRFMIVIFERGRLVLDLRRRRRATPTRFVRSNLVSVITSDASNKYPRILHEPSHFLCRWSDSPRKAENPLQCRTGSSSSVRRQRYPPRVFPSFCLVMECLPLIRLHLIFSYCIHGAPTTSLKIFVLSSQDFPSRVFIFPSFDNEILNVITARRGSSKETTFDFSRGSERCHTKT